jgi:cation diffusion facilitator family transporter
MSRLHAERRRRFLRKGALAAKVSTAAMMVLTVLKAVVGLLSGSIALVADAIHSVADVFTSLAVWIGLRLSEGEPSEKFPYGLYRAETLAFLVVSIVVAISGAQILLESFRRILTPTPVSLVGIGLSVAAGSAIVSYLLSQYKERIGKEINSQALQGEAKHSNVDVWSSALVFAGILLQKLGFAEAEGIAGLLIGALTIELGLKMGWDAILVLMDASLDPALLSKIRTIATDVDGVKGLHALKVRRSGPFLFAEMHVEVDSTMQVAKADMVSDAIEEKVRESINSVDSFLIHAEPMKKNARRIAIPIEQNDGLNSKISPHFGKSPNFLLIDQAENAQTTWFVVLNPGAKMNKKRGIEAAHILIEHGVDVVLADEVGEGPYHVLRDNSIQILKLNNESEIKRVLDSFGRKELRSLTPTQSN